MGIKRPLIILGSTVGAVASVLSYHPVANGVAGGSAEPINSAPATPAPPPTSTPTPNPTPTPSATETPTPTPTPSASANATSTPAPKAPAQKKSAQKKSAPKKSAPKSSSGGSAPAAEPTPAPAVAAEQSVVGATAQTRWGPVQVQITVKDGKIIDAIGLQYPDGDHRSQSISSQAIPWLVEETLAEQIADVQIIGGATYTSMGWRQSLASAMQKAGL